MDVSLVLKQKGESDGKEEIKGRATLNGEAGGLEFSLSVSGNSRELNGFLSGIGCSSFGDEMPIIIGKNPQQKL